MMSARSISWPSAAVITGAVRHRFMGQAQGRRSQKERRRFRIAPARQDIEDHIGGVNALREGFGACLLHRRHSFRQHSAEDLHHLAVAIRGALQLASDLFENSGKNPVLERCAVTQRPGFAKQNRHIMPGIVNRSVPAEVTRVVAADRLDPLALGKMQPPDFCVRQWARTSGASLAHSPRSASRARPPIILRSTMDPTPGRWGPYSAPVNSGDRGHLRKR
ncbi:hypothetical protein JCM7685_1448 [Paracoccus aminovorans]|nr:hypothetical protein JCM7685_1448 [Paracoccus aminovorans]